MIRLGPYSFSRHDAQVLLDEFDELWAGFAEGRDTTSIDELRRPVDVARAAIDTEAADDEALARAAAVAWQAVLAAGPALRSTGQLPLRAEGRVVQLSVSSGGVPKTPTTSVDVTHRGIVGDVQSNRRHHGRPFQALCIWSAEVIDAFAAEGHPIGPGLAGENITVSGLEWPTVRPGVRLQIGDVLCEVSCYATPCRKNSQWFLGGNHDLMHENVGGAARVYATVLEPGRIQVSDRVVLEP